MDRSLKSIALFFLLLAAILSRAQTGQTLLNAQLGSFQVRYKELMKVRGMDWYRSGEVDVLKIKEALSNYGADVLFYHFEKDTLYIWSISAERDLVSVSTPVKAGELQTLEKDFKWNLLHPPSANVLAQRSATAINESAALKTGYAPEKRLAEILFPAVIVSSLKRGGHIVVIPELNIASIPLYALQPFGNNDYLIDSFSISIAPSVDEMLNRIYLYCGMELCRDQGEVAFVPDSPLVVGNPDFSACKNVFQQLEGAEAEADYTATALKVTSIKGGEATKEKVIAAARSAELMYFATHGMADAEDPLNANYLIFAGGKEDCAHWTAKEIQFEKFKPQAMVVLSACKTGVGKAHEAGIIGLSRAFIKAGAGNVVMSLWNVQDAATKDLMKLYIDNLKVKQPFFPAENLRQAILEYKKQNADPAAWAAFLNLGMPYPVENAVKLKVD